MSNNIVIWWNKKDIPKDVRGWNVGLENPSLTPLFTELLDSSIRQSSHIFMHMRAIIHIKIKSKGEKVIP